MSKKYHFLKAIACISVLLLLAGACGNDSEESASSTTEPAAPPTSEGEEGDDVPEHCGPLPEMTKMVISGSQGNASYAPYYVAKELGVFEEYNLDVSIEPIAGGEALPLLATGRVDILTSTISAGMLNAIGSGLPIRWVAPQSWSNPNSKDGFYIRAELWPDGEDFDLSVLEGRTVASTLTGGTLSMMLNEQLLAAGVDTGLVHYAALGESDSLIALENGAVDMAYISSPYWAEAQEHADVKWVGNYFTFGRFPDETNGTAIFTGPSAEDHPEMVLAFFQAMRTTVERYFEGNYLADEEVASAITAAQGIPGASLEALERLDAAAYYRPDFALINGDELLERMQATFLTMGGLLDYDEPLTAAEVIDTSLVEQAMACPSVE